MSFVYHLRFGGRVVHVVGAGEGSLDAARGTFASLVGDEEVRPPFGLLVDVRNVRNAPSAGEARAIAEFSNSPGRAVAHSTALLVRPGVQYGIARMIQTVAEFRGARIAIFTDEAAALNWLCAEIGLAAPPDTEA